MYTSILTTILLCLVVISTHADNTRYERDLNGKVAIVTGGAKGIGYAITENFLKAGVKNIIIVDKNLPRGMLAEKTLNSMYGHRVLFIHGDVTTDLRPVVDIIFSTFECIDILVNNAGIIDESDPEKTILTNLLATMQWSELFYNVMRKDRGGKGGFILNLASITSVSKDPFYWNYKASKFGILGFSFGLGHEYNYLTSGVVVIAICPGFTDTDMAKQQMVIHEHVEVYEKLEKVVIWQQPDAVGKAAVQLYKTGTTGSAYTVVGGEVTVTPDRTNMTAEYLLNL